MEDWLKEAFEKCKMEFEKLKESVEKDEHKTDS